MATKARPASKPGGRPQTAVEIAPEGALAATIPHESDTPVYSFAPLAAGALVPGVAEANIRVPDAVAEAIRNALGQISPKSRAITLVLPDTAVRVFVLDFDTLPS